MRQFIYYSYYSIAVPIYGRKTPSLIRKRLTNKTMIYLPKSQHLIQKKKGYRQIESHSHEEYLGNDIPNIKPNEKL